MELVSELVYSNYRYNREQSPEITPRQWGKVFGPQSGALEQRYQMELATGGSPGDALAGEAQDCYEATIIEEARAIVEGHSAAQVSLEHLRVALAWLDGCSQGGALAKAGAPF